MTALRDEFGNRDAVDSSAPLKANIDSVKEMMAAQDQVMRFQRTKWMLRQVP